MKPARSPSEWGPAVARWLLWPALWAGSALCPGAVCWPRAGRAGPGRLRKPFHASGPLTGWKRPRTLQTRRRGPDASAGQAERGAHKPDGPVTGTSPRPPPPRPSPAKAPVLLPWQHESRQTRRPQRAAPQPPTRSPRRRPQAPRLPCRLFRLSHTAMLTGEPRGASVVGFTPWRRDAST